MKNTWQQIMNRKRLTKDERHYGMTSDKKKEIVKEAGSLLAKVVFLDYVSKFCNGKEELVQPGYFKEELKIEDLRSFEKKMIKEGYLKKSGSLKMTEKGYQLLDKNYDYLRFSSLAIPYADIRDYQRQTHKKKVSKASFEEIVITILLEKLKYYQEKDDYEAVKNIHFEVGKLYHCASYDAQAMYHYLISLYFEVSGLEYYDKLISFMIGQSSKKALEIDYDGVYIDPHIAQAIWEIKDVYFEDMADAVYDKNPININMCSLDKFKELVSDIISDKYDMDKWRGYFFSAFNGLVRTAEKNKANRR